MQQLFKEYLLHRLDSQPGRKRSGSGGGSQGGPSRGGRGGRGSGSGGRGQANDK